MKCEFYIYIDKHEKDVRVESGKGKWQMYKEAAKT